MAQQQQNTLKWGDVIRIHGVNLNKNEQEQSKGLIVSKGFTDSNIYYQKYTAFENVNFYRETLFQIMPISNFEIHDELSDPKNLKSPDRGSLKKKAEGEIESLNRNLELKLGENVLYGAEAIFRHIESNGYLRGLQKAADTGEGAFMIEASPLPSSQVIWKINSHRSYQHDGDPIFFDDELLIYHVSTDCFMNFVCNDSLIYLDSPILGERQTGPGDPGWEYVKKRPSIKQAMDIRGSIINENKSKCLWKFIEHCKAEQFYNKEKIKSHDIVYFEHTKNKGCISSSLSGDQYYLKETTDQKNSFESFWELIPRDINELGPEISNDFFARNIVTGNYLTYHAFRVQITSKEEVEGGGFLSHGLVNLICSEPNEEGEGKKLERGTLIPKDPNVPKTLKFTEDLYDFYELKDVDELTEDSFFIMKVDDETIRSIQYILSSHEHLIKFLRGLSSYMLKERERFGDKLSSIGPSENKLPSDSAQSDLKRPAVASILQYQDTPIDQLQNVRSILELIAGKIYGTTYSQIVSSGNTPNPTIQKIIVDTGTTELLIEIIFQFYEGFKHIENNPDASMDRVRKTRIADVFERVYRLLEKIVVGNSKNKFYLSRWVDLFLEHSKNINREYIQQCLVGILQNNPLAIEATINEAKIIDLIQRFYVEADRKGAAELTTKYLRLFSTFIRCEDRILKENQNIILEHFFKDKKNVFCYRFKVETKEDEAENPQDPFSKIKTKRVEIALDKQDFCPIRKYFKDWGPKWNYFLQFVNLLADVCMDKNANAIENVSALVTFQIVTIILNDCEIKNLNELIREANEVAGQVIYPIANVHEPFVRIAHYVYISNNKFTPIKPIKNISRWYRHQGEEKGVVRREDLNQTKRAFEGEKEEEEKFYINAILQYVEKFIEKCTQDNSSLNMLSTVLLLFKDTVSLGLWESIVRFRKLIPLLIMRIVKIEDLKLFNMYTDKQTALEVVDSNKQGLSFNRPENTLNINCKTKSTQIFRLMNQLEIDIRLRYMMNFFKGLYEATENFDDYNKQEEEQRIPEADVALRNHNAMEEFNKGEYAAILGEVHKISEDQDIMQKVNIWCNKFKELTPFDHDPQHSDNMGKNRHLFQGGDQQVPSFEAMVLALFELPVYRSDKLLNSSLRMLRMVFEQRKDLIEQFKGILVCGKGNLMEVYMTLKYMREKFDMLTNQNVLRIEHPRDVEFTYFIDQPYDANEKVPAQRSGILQDLFFLSRTLKEDINLKNIEALMLVEDANFDDHTIFNYLTEKERNNKLFQDMNIAEGIYLPLTSYIKLVGDRPLNQVHRRILFSIYHYLALLCFNNLEGKQKLMEYVLDVIPHLKRRVGAANFLYHVTLNNKNLIANTGLVGKIIDGALEACIELDREDPSYEQRSEERQWVAYSSFEKSQILFSLRGILLLNSEGFRINQELLMNRFQDNRFKRLIYRGKVEFISNRDSFSLTPEESYVACFFELFSVVVESKNFINVGKLENIHPYSYCLDCLKNTNRWQIRRALRAYINRLFYVNKDRDIFLFEEFIRKEFKILNDELEDLILLYRNKNINDEIPIPSGIRFKFAMSEIIEMILEIFITIEEMLLKPEFLKILKREIEKEERKPENQREIHDQLVKMLYSLGCLHKLYPTKNIVNSFLRQVRRHVEKVIMWFDLKFLEKQARQDNDAPALDDNDDLGVDQERKNYIYDHSKGFFRNLSCMIRDIKAKEKREEMKKEALKRERKEGTPEELKMLYIKTIFNVEAENLKPLVSKKYREVSTSLYKPHIQTANSRIFKLIAKPPLSENEENIELNRRLSIVKDLIDDSPVFRKLRENEFYKLVGTLTNINNTSRLYYEKLWLGVGQNKSLPVVPLKEIFTKSFKLIMNNHDTISDAEKIFVIKIARCYITEAVESRQNYKLPVDKWRADYFPGKVAEDAPDYAERVALQKELEGQLNERQVLIMECGGSEFIESIFKYNNTFSNRLELLNETLLLGIAYLFGGNNACQDRLLKVLADDPENSMMLSAKRLISSIGLILIEMRRIKDEAVSKDRDFAYSIVDTYDFFDSRSNIIETAFGMTGFDKSEMRNEKNNELALCRIFRFLQLFCENGNIQMKRFLLAQTNDVEGTIRKTNSVNFIETTSLLLRKLFKIMNNNVVAIPATLLDFINEITQLPCIENQIAFMKSTFFEDLSYLADYFVTESNLIARKFTIVAETGAEDEPITQLKSIYQKGIELALCNFEGNDNVLVMEFISKCQPKFLWMVIKQNLTVLLRERAEVLEVAKGEAMGQLEYEQALLSKFNKEAIEQYIDQTNGQSPMLRDQVANILSVLYIVKKVKLYQDNKYAIAFYDKNRPNEEEKKKAEKAETFLADMVSYAKSDGYEYIKKFLELFDELILSIEISSHNGMEQGFQYIYFPKHPIFKELSGQTRNDIMMRVKRETQRDKLITLLKLQGEVYEEINLNYTLKYVPHSVPFIQEGINFPITAEYGSKVRSAARNLSFLICFLMLFFIFIDHDTEEMTSTFTYTSSLTEFLIRVAAATQLMLTAWFMVIWISLRKPLALKKYDLEMEERRGLEHNSKGETTEDVKKLDESQVEGWDLLMGHYKNTLNLIRPYSSQVKDAIMANVLIRNSFVAAYSLATYEAGFLSILMFVVAAIMGNFVGVEWYTIHLFDIFTEISELTNIFKAILNNFKKLALLSFLAGVFILVFNVIALNTYTSVLWEDDLPEDACEDIVGCVLSLFTGGAIGESMDEFDYMRFIFDTVYVVFMEIMFQSIVGGIMIDAFSQLKEEDSAREEDKGNFCYVCGMTKPDMEKSGTTFEKHVSKHFLWNYLYYLYVLRQKDPTDFTGLEFDIDLKVNSEDVEWFPSMGEGDAEGEVEKEIERLEGEMNSVFTVMEETVGKSKQTLEDALRVTAKITG